jgi:hypothetical protein
MAECGKPNAKVTILTNPKADGYEHAKSLIVAQVLVRYRAMNLLLFLPDADGKDRGAEFQRLEQKAKEAQATLICCAAEQEVEVWLLAGHTDKLQRPWREIREDTSVKENVFEPFLKEYGDPRQVGGGRDALMKETLSNYVGLLERCPELKALQLAICNHVQSLQ